jgi:hypothetical protein
MFLNRISTRASPVDGGIGTGSVGGSLQNIKTALPSIDGNDIRKGLAARAAHPVAIQTANGELAFSSYMAMRQRWQTMTKNFLIASSIAGFGGFVCKHMNGYTCALVINSFKKQTFIQSGRLNRTI